EQITCDDLCVAIGDARLISLAAYVCNSWCGGVALEAMPLDEVAFLEGALIPRALDVGDKTQMVDVRPNVHHALLDLSLAVSPVDSEAARYARVLMVGAAVIGSEREFSDLWDSADALMADDPEVLSERLFSAAKIRGQTIASTALAVRQAIDYGKVFASAIEQLTHGACAPSVALAEGMGFAARLSVAQEKLELDDMLAQDDLFDMLGIGALQCDIDPAELVAALKAERFARSNRFLVALPFGFGRVRMASVEDELLAEHAAAWCAAHR
ncbi:MAG: 3-dehydroquinate synthase, partial [Coriobacteriales bacterium]|nr:3-dehydroquinate synthase [Coriobacteriales bacterium]